MIEVGGYKAFRGTMLITPFNSAFAPYTLSGDWLYKPEFNCWYSSGRSFPACVCTVVSEDG